MLIVLVYMVSYCMILLLTFMCDYLLVYVAGMFGFVMFCVYLCFTSLLDCIKLFVFHCLTCCFVCCCDTCLVLVCICVRCGFDLLDLLCLLIPLFALGLLLLLCFDANMLILAVFWF